jgi:hypothetical protein
MHGGELERHLRAMGARLDRTDAATTFGDMTATGKKAKSHVMKSSRGTPPEESAMTWGWRAIQAYDLAGKRHKLTEGARDGSLASHLASVREQFVQRFEHHLARLVHGFTLRVGARHLGDVGRVSAFLCGFEYNRDLLHSFVYYTVDEPSPLGRSRRQTRRSP